MRAHVQGVVLSLAAAIAVPSCASRPVARVPAVAFEATRALFDCQAALQARPERTAEARASLERAALLAPGWIAPLRWLDELDRQQLRGVDTLRAHRAVLARDPSDARRLYLAGRLEGKEGRRRFEQAVHFDPDLAWGWHGLSFAAAADGEHAASVAYARRALDSSPPSRSVCRVEAIVRASAPTNGVCRSCANAICSIPTSRGSCRA